MPGIERFFSAQFNNIGKELLGFILIPAQILLKGFPVFPPGEREFCYR